MKFFMKWQHQRKANSRAPALISSQQGLGLQVDDAQGTIISYYAHDKHDNSPVTCGVLSAPIDDWSSDSFNAMKRAGNLEQRRSNAPPSYGLCIDSHDYGLKNSSNTLEREDVGMDILYIRGILSIGTLGVTVIQNAATSGHEIESLSTVCIDATGFEQNCVIQGAGSNDKDQLLMVRNMLEVNVVEGQELKDNNLADSICPHIGEEAVNLADVNCSLYQQRCNVPTLVSTGDDGDHCNDEDDGQKLTSDSVRTREESLQQKAGGDAGASDVGADVDDDDEISMHKMSKYGCLKLFPNSRVHINSARISLLPVYLARHLMRPIWRKVLVKQLLISIQPDSPYYRKSKTKFQKLMLTLKEVMKRRQNPCRSQQLSIGTDSDNTVNIDTIKLELPTAVQSYENWIRTDDEYVVLEL